jgi:regulator of RNase E activity RraA
VDVGAPVKVGGLLVKPGDLIMGDKHGVLSIPSEIAKDVPKAVQLMEDWEHPIIKLCQSKEFTLEGLKGRYLSPRPTWPARK